jgi:hypothetical protein
VLKLNFDRQRYLNYRQRRLQLKVLMNQKKKDQRQQILRHHRHRLRLRLLHQLLLHNLKKHLSYWLIQSVLCLQYVVKLEVLIHLLLPQEK